MSGDRTWFCLCDMCAKKGKDLSLMCCYFYHDGAQPVGKIVCDMTKRPNELCAKFERKAGL